MDPPSSPVAVKSEPIEEIVQKNHPHNRRRKSKKSQPQKCIFCGKVVQNYFNLEMHMNVHTGERPWECSYCDANFSSYNVLIVHRNNLHLGKRFKCNLCFRMFNIVSHLYTHRKRVHPMVDVSKFKTLSSFLGKRKKGALKRQRFVKRGRPRLVKSSYTEAPKVDDVVTLAKEEDSRKAVEIESNPGTPVMTVNVLSKDVKVLSNLKVPVIKIQRLPDGVWKQKIMNDDSSRSHSPVDNDGPETEVSDAELEVNEEFNGKMEWEEEFKLLYGSSSSPTYPSPYSSVFQVSSQQPPPQNPLLPHQIPPLPPFNLAFPPFPFKLHNFTVPNNTANYSTDPYHHQPPPHPQQQQQHLWDTSFFLHLNRYKPEDSCHPTSKEDEEGEGDTPTTKKTVSSNKSPIKSTHSYQYVSKVCIKKRKIGFKDNKKQPKKKKRSRPTKTIKNSTPTTDAASVNLSIAEKGELIEETETGVFTCKECGKEFQIKWNLLTHLMTHTGERPFGCYFCKMRFRQKVIMTTLAFK